MKILALIAFSILTILVVGDSSSIKKKLQIGIKRRVDNCTLRSKRGDTLFVDYVVGLAWTLTCKARLNLCNGYVCIVWHYFCIGNVGGWNRVRQELQLRGFVSCNFGLRSSDQRMGTRLDGVIIDYLDILICCAARFSVLCVSVNLSMCIPSSFSAFRCCVLKLALKYWCLIVDCEWDVVGIYSNFYFKRFQDYVCKSIVIKQLSLIGSFFFYFNTCYFCL